MAEEQEKTIRVVQFSGKDEAKFRSFDAKLKAIGTSEGWHEALIDVNHVPKEESSATLEEQVLQNERIKNDSNAVTHLTLAGVDKAFPFVEHLSSAREMHQSLCDIVVVVQMKTF